MDEYLQGAVAQLIERGRVLTAKIPRNLPRDYDTLAQTARQKINDQLDSLKQLSESPIFKKPSHRRERLRLFKRIVAEMDLIETTAIAALDRAKADDHRLNALLERITLEIRFPLVTPVMTTLSQQYFHIYPDLNLLCVPLTEGQFLLHLPDLYHELAHPLLLEQNDPLVEPFQEHFIAALKDVLKYVGDEQTKEDRRFNGPVQLQLFLRVWEKAWVKFWMTELFCDLFATYTLGPAFAWSHLHLVAKRGANPFEIPFSGSSSHPADDARMRAMLCALRITGFSEESLQILRRWQAFLAQSGVKAEPEYHRCYPETILQTIAEHARQGLAETQIRIATPRIADPIHSLLNGAWDMFWKAPDTYVAWEKKAITELFSGIESRKA
jgi:hypothetical protein